VLKPFDEDLDLTGVPCPQNAARTLLRLAMMDSGEVLRVTLDDGEPIELVPDSVEDEEHAILERHQLEDSRWMIWIKAD
jgi:TusA-related sulfurtransferase